MKSLPIRTFSDTYKKNMEFMYYRMYNHNLMNVDGKEVERTVIRKNILSKSKRYPSEDS